MSYDYKAIVVYLLDWYDYNARILAWREKPRPYYIWVSEIMLQQTRVEAVKGYFDRFITALPDIQALAEAEEERLLKLWEGLGYYSRVRNLKKAAGRIMNEYNGELPADYNELLKLPGIGAYTAGAIASIAFNINVPAVDGNVLRVTKRIAGSFDDITKEKVKKEIWEDLRQIMPEERPGAFNQALMELGAMVCLPNGRPLCDRCPVMHLCKAFHMGTTMQIPVKPQKKERRTENRTILLIEHQGRYALHKRADTGLLAGLWELPGIEEKLSKSKLISRLKELELPVEKVLPLGEAKHIFSHVEWHMTGYYIRLAHAGLPGYDKERTVWADKEEISNRYSIPNAFSAYVKPLLTGSS